MHYFTFRLLIFLADQYFNVTIYGHTRRCASYLNATSHWRLLDGASESIAYIVFDAKIDPLKNSDFFL